MLTKSQIYNKVKIIAQKLGMNIDAIKKRYRTTKKLQWLNELEDLEDQYEQRTTFVEEIQNLSPESKVGIKMNISDLEKIYDNLFIENIKPQELFNNIVEYKIYDYDPDFIREYVIENIINDGNYFIKITTNLTTRNIAVTYNTLPGIIKMLTTGIYSKVNNNDFSSDSQYDIAIEDIRKIELIEIEKPDKKYEKNGGFFPYNNVTNIDLTRYQIFNNYGTGVKREQCLFHCLQLLGISADIINSLKIKYQCTSHIAKKDLKKISEDIGVTIKLYQYYQTDKIYSEKYGDFTESISIAIYENHYFVHEMTEFNNNIKQINLQHLAPFYYHKKNGCYYAENLNAEPENNYIKLTFDNKMAYQYNKSNLKIRYNGKKISSLKLINELFKIGGFKKQNMVKFAESHHRSDLREHYYLNKLPNEQRLVRSEIYKCFKRELIKYFEIKNGVYERVNIYVADTETFTEGAHKLKLLAFADMNQKTDDVIILDVNNKKYKSSDCPEKMVVLDFIKTMTCNGKMKKVICYFHNLKYDYYILEKYLHILSICDKDNQYYSVQCKYLKSKIEFRDSYKLLPMSLASFNNALDLPKELDKKEAIAYSYYKPENYNKIIPCSEYTKLLPYSQIKTFYENVEACKSFKNNCFNPDEYYKIYLKYDVLVLKHGLYKFNEMVKKISKKILTIEDFLTISSFADKYAKLNRCYDNIYEITGNLREYIGQSVYGGRVVCNKKYLRKTLDGKFSDFDAVSCYPSAIVRLCNEGGFPIGMAKRGRRRGFSLWTKSDYCVMTVKIKAINKYQQLPMIAVRTDKSISYVNNLVNGPITVIIDKFTLEDYIKFHDIEYEILDMVYWDDGLNNKMGEIMQYLHDERCKHKKNNKAMANVLKLIMNSIYGKNNIKASYNKKMYVQNNKVNQYIYNNFNTIREVRKINEYITEIKLICSDSSYNRAHIGGMILSKSKTIMNEVFNTANDNKINFYYSDTDSIHMDYDDIEKLNACYRAKYNRELVGKNLGQFHNDFDLKNAIGDVYSTKLIILDKKTYCDKLCGKDSEGNVIEDYHYRLKGVTREGLNHEAKKYDNNYIKMYEHLATGAAIDFVLNPFDADDNKQKVLFDFRNNEVKLKQEFVRKVQYTNDPQIPQIDKDIIASFTKDFANGV